MVVSIARPGWFRLSWMLFIHLDIACLFVTCLKGIRIDTGGKQSCADSCVQPDCVQIMMVE